jgi:hypothetical protein
VEHLRSLGLLCFGILKRIYWLLPALVTDPFDILERLGLHINVPPAISWTLAGLGFFAATFLTYHEQRMKALTATRRMEGPYKFALSLDQVNYGTKETGIDLELVLSNTLRDRPLMYRIACAKLYVEINGSKHRQPDRTIKGTVIPAGKSSTFLLGIFKAPTRYPYTGLLHYEIAYGHPDKLLFHQVTELKLHISGPTHTEFRWTIVKQDDRQFKDSEFCSA